MKQELTRKSRGATLVLAGWLAVGAFVPLGGCALILGIEEQESTFDPSNPYNGLTFSALCKDYCDAVTENCGEVEPQYLSTRNCIFTCMSLEPGDPNEAGGNNVECRLKNADRAKGAGAAEFCKAAGPTSDPECGSNCETWCRLLEQECPTDFSAIDDCEQACRTIPDRGDFDTTADYENVDNIQCRILHLGSVARSQKVPDESHCDHGSYIPTKRCLVPADTAPACEDYCRVVMGNCRGQNAVYESEEQCAAACAVLDPGEFSNDFDDNRNTVGCRTYHSKAAALGDKGSGAETHCKHAGPTGGGFCGTYEDDAPTTGTCESYCRLLHEGCEDAFDASFEDEDDCAASCKTDFTGAGADAMSLYSVGTAPDENNLQCRTYHAVLALTEAAKDAPDDELLAGFCVAASADKDSECEVPEDG